MKSWTEWWHVGASDPYGDHAGYGRALVERVRDFFRFGEDHGRRELRAPRGYVRPDERIREDVCDRLMCAHWIDPTDVEVRVERGEVTLDGTVRRRGDKRAIEDIAESVLGAKEVHNRLRLQQEEMQTGRSTAGSATMSAPGGMRSGTNESRTPRA
jgi:hypothetical protein